MPWILEELDGCAEGAAVDPEALFAASVEEHSSQVPDPVRGRCSDLMAVPPATANGHVLVAHNNDLSPAMQAHIVAIEWIVDGDPVVFTLGILGGLVYLLNR